MKLPDSLIRHLQKAKSIVAFTGAGVSAESGIPTFRDPLAGLWARFDAEELATPDAFRKDRDLVWGWYEWRRMKIARAQPNPAHQALARMMDLVPEITVVTQNVDDLHERAGSADVIHLHGEIAKPKCSACHRPYPASLPDPVEPEEGRRITPPQCPTCGGNIRPGVVWFGEPLPEEAWSRAVYAAQTCDLMFVIGTSGLVMPAARMPLLAGKTGAKIIEINPAPSLDTADWQIGSSASEAFEDLMFEAFCE